MKFKIVQHTYFHNLLFLRPLLLPLCILDNLITTTISLLLSTINILFHLMCSLDTYIVTTTGTCFTT